MMNDETIDCADSTPSFILDVYMCLLTACIYDCSCKSSYFFHFCLDIRKESLLLRIEQMSTAKSTG